jgi:hypothetical protein
MKEPWLQIEQCREDADQSWTGSTDHNWQALFACQIGVRSHVEWAKLKWGFNASALFDEALDRQKLFLETQYTIKNELKIDPPNLRTIAFRFSHKPGEDLLLAVIGKIRGQNLEHVTENALSFFRELKSTFPYDYTLSPAVTREEYSQLAGYDIIDRCAGTSGLVQIKRAEFPAFPDYRSSFTQGFWQSTARAHEQIWRALGCSIHPTVLNISLRSTVLYPGELDRLANLDFSTEQEEHKGEEKKLRTAKQMRETFLERRLNPWQKLFYVQVHLVSTQNMDDSLIRVAGTALTLSDQKKTNPGYQAVLAAPELLDEWRKKIKDLDIIFSTSQLPVYRLEEIADMEEVAAVIRLPYSPPENGFPDFEYSAVKGE